MNSINKDSLELTVWKEIAGLNLSVSHDRWHIDRVLSFAYELHELYGGDKEVLTLAAIMHDLGRADRTRAHGEDSRKASVERAKQILTAIGYPPEKHHNVIMAIEEHDQTHVIPSTIEGRILKEADFLAGFGAWGILRIAMWSGESQRNTNILLERLSKHMPKRLSSLEFSESSYFGRQEMLFTKLFLQELEKQTRLKDVKRNGCYIVLEGISGSGKDTQAQRLLERLNTNGYSAVLVREPGDIYRKLRDTLKRESEEDPLIEKIPTLKKYLLMTDRYELIHDQVIPALNEGKIVVSIRSFISTLVYQCQTDYEVTFTAFEHSFNPLPDLIILFDLEPRAALQRINLRPQNRGAYEAADALSQHRERYKMICKLYFDNQLQFIDASREIATVADNTWAVVQSLVSSRVK